MNAVHDFGLCGAILPVSKDDEERAVRVKVRAEQALRAMGVGAALYVTDKRGWHSVIAEAVDDIGLARIKAVLAHVAMN